VFPDQIGAEKAEQTFSEPADEDEERFEEDDVPVVELEKDFEKNGLLQKVHELQQQLMNEKKINENLSNANKANVGENLLISNKENITTSNQQESDNSSETNGDKKKAERKEESAKEGIAHPGAENILPRI
jgi:hypothetical protein